MTLAELADVLTPFVIFGAIPCWAAYLAFWYLAHGSKPQPATLEERRDRSFVIAVVATVFSVLAAGNSVSHIDQDFINAVGALAVVLLDGYALYLFYWLWKHAR